MLYFTGGKTGGHIFPLVNLIKSIDTPSKYVGYNDFLEEKVCKDNGIDFVGLDYKKGYFNILKCVKKLNKLIDKNNVSCVISTGGFVSAPLVIYAILNKIPIYLFEENTILGSFNKIMYPFCKKMFVAYKMGKMKKKYVHTGLPMKKIKEHCSYDYDILIIGGSLGSKPLCDLALRLNKSYKVLLVAGRYYNDYKNKNINIIEFSNDIYTLILSSRCVITRGGAMSMYEVMYLKRPLIVIPSENTKKNHQVINAKLLSEKKALIMVRESDMNLLIDKKIKKVLYDSSYKNKMLEKQKDIIVNDSAQLIMRVIKNV